MLPPMPSTPASWTRSLFAAAALCTALAACRVDPPPSPLEPRKVHVVDEWVVEVDQETLGRVILIEIEDPVEPVRRYLARNRSEQRLGYVDPFGRVYRFEPFEEHEVFVGTYPMDEGMALLFELDSPPSLTPLSDYQAREAAARTGDSE